MSEHTTEKEANCVHLFARHGRRKIEGYWLRQKWWKCVRCGYESRSYDSVDRMMTRPIHPFVSVAVPGYNTVGSSRDDRCPHEGGIADCPSVCVVLYGGAFAHPTFPPGGESRG